MSDDIFRINTPTGIYDFSGNYDEESQSVTTNELSSPGDVGDIISVPLENGKELKLPIKDIAFNEQLKTYFLNLDNPDFSSQSKFSRDSQVASQEIINQDFDPLFQKLEESIITDVPTELQEELKRKSRELQAAISLLINNKNMLTPKAAKYDTVIYDLKKIFLQIAKHFGPSV